MIWGFIFVLMAVSSERNNIKWLHLPTVSLSGLGTLQEVEVPIISQSSCQEMYLSDPTEQVDILSDMICAGYQKGGKDSCQVLFDQLFACLFTSQNLNLFIFIGSFFKHLSLKCIWLCVIPSGWLRGALGLPDGKWDLGAGWRGELRDRLCSAEQARRVRAAHHLLKLHQEQHTRGSAVWSSPSHPEWERCFAL